MQEHIVSPPIISLVSGMKGLLGGGFMGLAVFMGWDPFARLLLFVIGFIAFVDSVMPVDRKFYAVTSGFFLIIGALAAFFTSLGGLALGYLVFLIVIGIIVYIDKIRRMRRLGRIR